MKCPNCGTKWKWEPAVHYSGNLMGSGRCGITTRKHRSDNIAEVTCDNCIRGYNEQLERTKKAQEAENDSAKNL